MLKNRLTEHEQRNEKYINTTKHVNSLRRVESEGGKKYMDEDLIELKKQVIDDNGKYCSGFKGYETAQFLSLFNYLCISLDWLPILKNGVTSSSVLSFSVLVILI